ncbi:MAG: hypothetical protein GDA52_01910 [Rhodobacteraceae bacterium]|nr:hypothetical protein [Paracoccaceae bacterium]
MSTRDPDALIDPVGWTGDVWKTVAALLDLRPDLRISIVAAHKTGLACISGLDPGNSRLRDSYDELLVRYQGVEMSDIGADGYYGCFPLIDPKDFLAQL